MAVAPEHHFDLKAAALSLAEILNKDALSENRFRDEAAISLPKFHGAASWINNFLYIVVKVETLNGSAFAGFETIFYPEGTFREYSVEYENVHDLWAYEIAGESFLKELDFEDSDRITWLKTDRNSFIPSTWNDLLDFNNALNGIWIQD